MRDNAFEDVKRLVHHLRVNEVVAPIKENPRVHITDHAQLGRLTAACSLLTNTPLKVIERPDCIVVEVGTDHNLYREFENEYALIVWLYEQIQEYAEASIVWFKEHEQAFNTPTQ
jgi:hypothetical protein